MGVPPNHPKLDHVRIETDCFEIPPFEEPPIYIMLILTIHIC